MKLPNTIKNPRKLKKAWRKAILANTLRSVCGGDRVMFRRCKLRWKKHQGWVMTYKCIDKPTNLVTEENANA